MKRSLTALLAIQGSTVWGSVYKTFVGQMLHTFMQSIIDLFVWSSAPSGGTKSISFLKCLKEKTYRVLSTGWGWRSWEFIYYRKYGENSSNVCIIRPANVLWLDPIVCDSLWPLNVLVDWSNQAPSYKYSISGAYLKGPVHPPLLSGDHTHLIVQSPTHNWWRGLQIHIQMEWIV